MTRHAAVFAAAISAFAASVSPSAAVDLNAATNIGYVQCLKYAETYANTLPAGAERDAAYAKLRQTCNRAYLANRLSID